MTPAAKLAPVCLLLAVAPTCKAQSRAAEPPAPPAAAPKVLHQTIKVGDLDIFYREAGPKDAPAVLLLHGFPTSPQMVRTLTPKLADKYRVVAPDYLAKVIDAITVKVELKSYALHGQDYGAPVGYGLASAHPDRITTIVVQYGNAYDEGLDNDFWKPIKTCTRMTGRGGSAGPPNR